MQTLQPEADATLSEADAMLSFYEQVRSELADRPDTCVMLDRAASELRAALRRVRRISVGLVGESQVGKSSLVNALLEKRALPAGGVGPLTAQALHVSWGAEEVMDVTYHGRGRLNRLLFAVEQHLQRAGTLSGPVADQIEREDDPEDTEAGSTVPARIEFYRAQMRRLLCETIESDADPIDLVNGLRAVLGMPSCAGRSVPLQWEGRITAISEKMGTKETINSSAIGGTRSFDKELCVRAAGWLSPLVERLNLVLPDQLLYNIDLVDLPGIGVVGDDAAKIAGEFVRREAGTIVAVVRNAGFAEALASLLESTGIITRLLFSSTDDTLPLVVVVTHLDDVARSRWVERRKAAREAGEPIPDPERVFRELAQSMDAVVRRQLGEALRRSQSYQEAEGEERAQREIKLDLLTSNIHVHCVAAPDFLNLSTGDDDLAFLKCKDATGIPGLRITLSHLGRNERLRQDKVVQDATEVLRLELRGALEIARSQFCAAEEDAVAHKEILTAVNGVAAPLREKMKAFHGEVIAFLRDGLPQRVKLLCTDAVKSAERRLRRLLSHGASLHFASLQAALKRSGVYTRRDIDYPSQLTNAFVEGVASTWEPTVVASLRDEVSRLAERDARLVGELLDCIRHIRGVDPTPVDALRQSLPVRAKGAVSWRQERFEALRRDVHDGLHTLVAEEMERACDGARRAGKDRGKGAKKSILDVFARGGQQAIEHAGARAVTLLTGHLDKLVTEIRSGYLAENADPLATAVNALLSRTPPIDLEALDMRRERRERIESWLHRMGTDQCPRS